MIFKISDRISECRTGMSALTSEMNDYNTIIMCLKALQAVSKFPDKFQYEQEDYDLVLEKLRSLCQKHEIHLPDYIEWDSIEIY